MSRKVPLEQCPRCKNTGQWFTGKICHNCYRRYKWVPKKKICPRCKRLKVLHARGHCGGCYTYVFRLDEAKAYNYKKYHNISIELYRKITKQCLLCNFDKAVELHHVDDNHSNNSPENMVGLCPNHHKMIHLIKYRDFLKDVVEKLMTAERLKLLPETPAITNIKETEEIACSVAPENPPIELSIRKENLVRPCLPN